MYLQKVSMLIHFFIDVFGRNFIDIEQISTIFNNNLNRINLCIKKKGLGLGATCTEAWPADYECHNREKRKLKESKNIKK